MTEATTRRSGESDPRELNPVLAHLSSLRPKQWLKNVLVFAAPLAAGVLLEPDVLKATTLAFVAFCLVASSGYLVNDLVDVEHDRAHPSKRYRPIASGAVSQPTAVAGALALTAAGVALGFMVRPELGIVVIIYIACTLAYSLWLKAEPVVELALLSSGFLLRAIAGGVACDIPLSTWFLLVAAFGSLFMGTGKRYSELLRPDGPQRASLAGYTPTFLRFVWTMSATICIVAYCLWATEVAQGKGSVWAAVSMAPFVLAIVRYALEVDLGKAEAPEDVVLGCRAIQAFGALWLATFAMAAFDV